MGAFPIGFGGKVRIFGQDRRRTRLILRMWAAGKDKTLVRAREAQSTKKLNPKKTREPGMRW